jgi:hypothetical protein
MGGTPKGRESLLLIQYLMLIFLREGVLGVLRARQYDFTRCVEFRLFEAKTLTG